MTIPSRPTVSILAVGTELTTGQIQNRNASRLSVLLGELGAEVREHRVVPDDHALITRALSDAESGSDWIWVTGGLGPTSDDFTRQVISSWAGQELEWSEPSWQKIVIRLQKRGVPVAEANRQQCYFPKEASILPNPRGTAEAFALEVRGRWIVALPGPPAEIESIWSERLRDEVKRRLPENLALRKLRTWQCLGLSEAAVGERVEHALEGSDLDRGYRVHLPFVEVKVWDDLKDPKRSKLIFERLTEALKPYVVIRDADDGLASFAEVLSTWLGARPGLELWVDDYATSGKFLERLRPLLSPSGVLSSVASRIQVLTRWGARPQIQTADLELVGVARLVISAPDPMGDVTVGWWVPGEPVRTEVLRCLFPSPELKDRNQAAVAEQVFLKVLRFWERS